MSYHITPDVDRMYQSIPFFYNCPLLDLLTESFLDDPGLYYFDLKS